MIRIHGGTATTIATRYEYDHMGRKLATMESINGYPEIVLSKLSYNDVGQLLKKELHSTDGNVFLQKTGYTYNERGWLKTGLSDEFSFRLSYDEGTLKQYNGNIAHQAWGAGAGTLPNVFSYGYDKLNRLINASSTGITMSEELGYDEMGNIKSLNRDGLGISTYNYVGTASNQLFNVVGGSLTTNNYVYDANGNVTTDGRTGALLSYNHLNLPISATGSGLSIAYSYDATGNKLTKVSNGAVTQYVSGIHYKPDGTIDFIQTEAGMARRVGVDASGQGTYSYEYTLSDHLGNSRYSFDVYAGAVRRIQQQDYYAFGKVSNGQYVSGDKNNYLYNGKELQELGQFDYGARFYDPVIGRWNVVDPMAEKMRTWSPYTYAFNNPIRFIDIGGMIPYPITIRSFAPMNTFGRGFHGDGASRGFTTSSTATARVHQRINFDTDKTSMGAKVWSSPTSHILVPGSLTENPTVSFTGLKISSSGDAKKFEFGTHAAGANPMVPNSPAIDVFSDFSITENKKAGTLSICGKLTGDNFPSTEAFITDPSGNNAFIGVGAYEGSPFTSLDGENKRDITSFKFDITTDKKGNFTGVRVGDRTYKLDEWNKIFEKKDLHKE